MRIRFTRISIGYALFVASLGYSQVNPVAPALTVGDAVSKGTVSLDERLRWEYADQTNLRSSNAFTLASRLGYTTASLDGFQAMMEGENVAVIGNDSNYNAAGTNVPGGTGRTSIADPAVTDINQLWLDYSGYDSVFKLGRQRIVLDNARFVGDSGWRQNMQTFDAATFTLTPVTGLSLYYGYIWRVSRVYGNKAPQPDFKSDSHLVNVAYSGIPYGKLVAYSYLLNFKNSAANSSQTFGASFAGSMPLSTDSKLTYRAEAATQSGAYDNPVAYTASYYDGELGATLSMFDAGLGYEVLGSDDGKKGFATPLATLHIFNGWDDEFLTTPANGLRDSFVSAGIALPGGFPFKVIYHKYESDFGSHNYGKELDTVVSHKLTKHWSVLAKFARYDGELPFFSTTKFWLQTELTF